MLIQSDEINSASPRLARDCRRLSQAIAATAVILGVLMALETVGPWLVKPPSWLTAIGGLIDLAAPVAYLAALWRLERALRLFADTRRFFQAAALAVRSVGQALIVGGLWQAVFDPTLRRLLGIGRGYFIALDFAAIVTVALGLSLWAFARLFARAARLEMELETIL